MDTRDNQNKIKSSFVKQCFYMHHTQGERSDTQIEENRKMIREQTKEHAKVIFDKRKRLYDKSNAVIQIVNLPEFTNISSKIFEVIYRSSYIMKKLSDNKSLKRETQNLRDILSTQYNDILDHCLLFFISISSCPTYNLTSVISKITDCKASKKALKQDTDLSYEIRHHKDDKLLSHYHENTPQLLQDACNCLLLSSHQPIYKKYSQPQEDISILLRLLIKDLIKIMYESSELYKFLNDECKILIEKNIIQPNGESVKQITRNLIQLHLICLIQCQYHEKIKEHLLANPRSIQFNLVLSHNIHFPDIFTFFSHCITDQSLDIEQISPSGVNYSSLISDVLHNLNVYEKIYGKRYAQHSIKDNSYLLTPRVIRSLSHLPYIKLLISLDMMKDLVVYTKINPVIIVIDKKSYRFSEEFIQVLHQKIDSDMSVQNTDIHVDNNTKITEEEYNEIIQPVVSKTDGDNIVLECSEYLSAMQIKLPVTSIHRNYLLLNVHVQENDFSIDALEIG